MTALDRFLKKFNYRIDKEIIDTELNSHPDFPSFKAYTDTLKHFDIPNLAVTIPKDQFKKIVDPVLVIIQVNGKSDIAVAELVDDNEVKLNTNGDEKNQVQIPFKEFIAIWDGSLIAIETNSQKQKLRLSKLNVVFVLLASLTLIQSVSGGFNSSSFIYSALTVVGLLLSYLVAEVSINPQVKNSKFCTFGKSTDCSSVINSASSKFIGYVSLSDLSIIFFSSIYLALLVKVDLSVLAWISLLTLPVIAYSVYQQGIVLKKWCLLCLGIGLTLGLQFVFSYTYLSLPIGNDLTLSFGLLVLSFTLISLAWFQLKPVLNDRKEMVNVKQELRRFKRNYHLFIPYFQTLPVIDTNISSNDIHLGGNPNASVKILAITNPLCKHCFDVHHMLKRILEKHPNQVAIDLRFLVPIQNSNDSTILIATGLLKAFKEEEALRFRQIIGDWYNNPDIKSWLKKAGMEKVEDQYLGILNDHRHWCTANGIGRTPVILVNNRMFPHSYESTDLENMIEGLIEYYEANEISAEKEKLQPN